MPKMKTQKGAAKRLKKTAGGKIKRAKAFRRHILTKKAPKRKRQLRGGDYVHASDVGRVLILLPN